MLVKGKVVVITGAAAGVGRAVAHRFAKGGARLGLIARDAEALDELKREVEDLGSEAVVAPADVADAGQVFDAASAIEAQLGPIDIWINNAATTIVAPIWRLSPPEFKRVTEVNYLGFVHGTMAALRSMQPQRSGLIVQVGSALAYGGMPLQSAYCGAKHAIRGFTDSVRDELRGDGSPIRLTVVELPAINTPQFDWARTRMTSKPQPIGEVYQPEVAADAIWTAVHWPWREYWLGADTILGVLGNLVAPGLMDRMKHPVDVDEPDAESQGREGNLDQPVGPLHRTRGSFGIVARDEALLAPGPVVRLGVIVGGALAFLGAGWLGGRLARRQS
jgi:NAD(P)-dependent dehydrogenase (short-subunit alcohol dehydrogenase family)